VLGSHEYLKIVQTSKSVEKDVLKQTEKKTPQKYLAWALNCVFIEQA
jgi:hypothetical protein